MISDGLKRALHTFWQTLLGSLGAVWVASGIDVSQIKDIDAAKKAGLALAAAVAAAALSAAKTAIVQTLANRKAPLATAHPVATPTVEAGGDVSFPSPAPDPVAVAAAPAVSEPPPTA